jgi:uncharacterized protein
MSTATRGAGGTKGGIGEFLLGLALMVVGGYLLMNQITVSTGAWLIGGVNAFGLLLIPFVIGVVLVFLKGNSTPGWLLIGLSVLCMIAGVIINLNVYFRSTSLFNTLGILALLGAGLGLLLRAVREH